jgi:hypothetical protein
MTNTSVPGATVAQDCRGPSGEHQGSTMQGFCGCAAAHWIDNIYHHWTLQDIPKVGNFAPLMLYKT